jgi:hypothetical protein
MKRLIIISLVICLSAGVANAAMRKGPYLLYPGSNDEMMVLWQLDTTQTCTLEWGEDTTYSSGSVQTTEFGADHQHEHVITNLTPGVKYYYRVTESVSHTGSFTAAPVDVDVGNVKFLAYGDTRTQANRHDEVAGGMISAYTTDPDCQTITLLSGDWTNNDSENDWTTQFFPRDRSNLLEFQANMPINGCIGNHEGAGNNFLKYWPYPYVSGFYWSFDYGPVHIAVLDQYHSGGYAPASAQHIWLENDLATTTKEWKFIVLHQPGWGAGTHANTAAVQNYIQPLCETYGVDFVIAGHNHNYARAVVNGVQHITTGGGGAPLYAVDLGMPYIVAGESTYHFCKIDIQGYDLYFEAVRTNGTLIDSVFIQHDVPVPPGQATNPNPSDLATDVGINADLSWTAGTGASSHDVYFGTNPTPGAGQFQGNQTTATFDPGVMDAETTYYWRIDEVNPVGTTTGTVWSFTTVPPIPPGQAGNPSPADLATDVDNNTDLNWSAGSGADSHDVYFGAVSPGVFQGNQTGTTFDPGTLAFNTSYYWRIDEVNPFGTTTGTVWSFTTQIAPPHIDTLNVTDGWNEKDGKTFVEDDKVYVFTSSDNDRWDVEKGYYISLDLSDISFTPNAVINSVTVYCEHYEEEGFSSGNLEFRVGTGWPGSPATWATYSPAPVHIDENNEATDSWDVSSVVNTTDNVNQLEFYFKNNDNDKKSKVDHVYVVVEWTEAPSAPGQAGNPSPVDAATDVSLTADLSWTAGSGATSHDVYFGTSSPGAFQGNQSTTTFDPGTMADNTTYYWRIDEKNSGGTTTGIVWSFTTITLDTDPPTPDPMTWAAVPVATSDTAITMTADTASDPSGVEYFFECLTVGGHDSGWQDSTTYTDTGLSPETQYTYRVKARDKSSNQNETGWSSSESATTEATPDTTPPTPDPMTWAAVPAATSDTAITMTAYTATDPCGVEYYFECLTVGGHDSGWQDSTTYTDTGLSPETQYTYRVKARDKSPNQNETGWSTSESATTEATPDTTPPTPDPMTWASVPAATGTTSISMTADTASDPSGVEYFFECLTTGGHDSGWQSSPTYEDTGLQPSTQYTYRVKARDLSTNQNETAWSSSESATTQTPDTTPPTPDPMTWSAVPTATSDTAITMTANTASDPSGVEYYFECLTVGGHDSGWQDSTTYTDTGLSPETQYTYRVKARDKSPNQNETGWSSSESATTEATPDTTPPTPDPMTWASAPAATGTSSISMTATTASDPCGVEYFFDCLTTGGHDSGWQDSTTYVDTGLNEATQYTYRVKARDKSPNQNETGWSSSESATTQDGTAPTPDPMTWATVPYATGSTSISMTANTASDPSGVEYFFECLTTGGNDSGWQDSTTYTDTGLSPETQYTYRVKARDKSSNQNETGWSTSESATTEAVAPHSDTLTVTDGWNESGEKTFVEDGKVYVFNSSDDDRWGVEKEYYISLQLSNISFPAGATINSVTVYCEHYEEEGFSSGNLEFRVGTGWPGSPATWATYSPAPVHIDEENEAVDSWDVSSVVNTTGNVNQLEFYIKSML